MDVLENILRQVIVVATMVENALLGLEGKSCAPSAVSMTIQRRPWSVSSSQRFMKVSMSVSGLS